MRRLLVASADRVVLPGDEQPLIELR